MEFINRSDYPSYYQYRKALKYYGNIYDVKHRVCGGVAFFASVDEYNTWRHQI